MKYIIISFCKRSNTFVQHEFLLVILFCILISSAMVVCQISCYGLLPIYTLFSVYFAYQFTMKIWRPKTLFLIIISAFLCIVLYYNLEKNVKIKKNEETVKDLAGESLNFDFKFDDTSEDIKIFGEFSETEV